MAYLKFLESDSIHKCIVIPNKNITTLKFESEKEIM